MSVPMFVANVALTIASFIVRGWALSAMWGWFIVKQFGLPPISYPEALGMSGLIAMLTFNPFTKMHDLPFWQNMIISIVMNLMFAGFGWVWSRLL